jgi:hypothetical protein
LQGQYDPGLAIEHLSTVHGFHSSVTLVYLGTVKKSFPLARAKFVEGRILIPYLLVLIVGNGWVAGGCGRMILIDIGIIM